MKITYWKGVFVADHAPQDCKLLEKCGFAMHEPTLCRSRSECRGCRARIGRRYFSTRMEDATRLRGYCTPTALSVMKDHLRRLAMSRATESSIVVPAPPGLSFRPFQRAGIAYAVQHKDTLCGDDMGLGKTIQALGFWNIIRPRSILVVCPATLVLNWKIEAEKWLVDDYVMMIPDSTSDAVPPPEESGERLLVIVNYEKIVGVGPRTKVLAASSIDPGDDPPKIDDESKLAQATDKQKPLVVVGPAASGRYRALLGGRFVRAARKIGRAEIRCLVLPLDVRPRTREEAEMVTADTPLLASLRRPWDTAAYDEAQALKNPDSMRSRAVLGKDGIFHHIKRNLFLSGTPVENYARELWPVAAAVCPAKFGDYWEFATRYCGLHTERRGQKTVVVADGFTHQAELQQRLRSTFLIRRRKTDVLKELPPKMRQLMILDDSDVEWSKFPEFLKWQETATKLFEQEVAQQESARSEAEYRKGVRSLKPVTVQFTEVSKWRHALGLLKLPVCLKFSDEQLSSGLDSLVIFAYHHDVVEQIQEHYGDDACVIYGNTPVDERMELVTRFQRKERKIFVGALKVAGTGITLTRSAAVDFFETDWNPATINQAEDRLARMGQTRTVSVVFPALNNSLDANMLKRILKKQTNINMVLDDDPEKS